MTYVMEVGPIADGSWAVFAVNLAVAGDKAITSRIGPHRAQARRALADSLGEAPVSCCPTLGSFGGKRGWRVAPVPLEVWRMAATLVVSLEIDALGPLAFSPALDAWLRACAMFLEAEPWRTYDSHVPLLVRLEGEPAGSRVAAVFGQDLLPPGLIILPDLAAFERTHRGGRADDGDDGFDDAVVLTLSRSPCAVASVMKGAFGQAFAPTLVRLRGDRLSAMTAADLKVLMTSTTAVAALGTGLDVGIGRVAGLTATASALPLWCGPAGPGQWAS